ncbi:astacin [Ancylostoma duodenale]|uniref:Metalloendopeptidase n=1 Tax=Ancylostoma duodenale TaxID=51022 RepID=A0A0C2G3V0_9BILA|nr:astacin [Ancylostoma duodenale]
MRALVRKAFQFWEDNTCLTFEENGTNTPVLNITKGGGCWSSLGLQLGKESQTISLNEGCAVVGAIIHEIAHALSVDHTMTRSDRDQYIDIDFSNVLEQDHYNFNKEYRYKNITDGKENNRVEQ